MSLKDSFREYVEKNDRKLSNVEASFRGRFRNKKYHGYFEGYTEYTVKKGNGLEKIRRVYTADYYRQTISEVSAVFLRIAYAVMLAVAAYCLFSGSMNRSASCNYAWYVTIWQTFCIVFVFWIFTIVLNYLTIGRSWRIYDYRVCHEKLLTASKLAAISFAAAEVSVLAYSIIFRAGECLDVAAKFLLAGLAVFLMNRIESGIKYKTVKNTVEKSYAGGVEIK